MKKCEHCGHTKWQVFYDDVSFTYQGTMTTIVENADDVGYYDEDNFKPDVDASFPVEVDANYSEIIVACNKCGYEVDIDTEEDLERWLGNEE